MTTEVMTDNTAQQQLYAEWLEKIAQVCERVAEGDLEARVIAAPQDVYLHRIAVAVNRMLDQADAFVREARVSLDCASKGRFHRRFVLRGMKGAFRVGARMINQATGEMARQSAALRESEAQRVALADELERNVKTIAERVTVSGNHIRATAQALTGAAEKTTSDAIDVAQASLNCSDSVKNVAASTEQLAVAFGEIEAQANDSAKVVHQAVASADRINTVIKQLDEASTKIGGVVRIISQIARQTNLLALNATIEAARSGEAGRGFAVVASEVKHLAQQTASATEEIETEVNSIQQVAHQTAEAITGISSTIHAVDHIAKNIASSVNSQREATTEINRSVQLAAEATEKVSSGIDGVSNTARQASENAVALLQPADELMAEASRLGDSIDVFVKSIRAHARP